MTWFILASAGLAILCLLLLLPGVIRPRRVVSVDMSRENLAIARERLAEVDPEAGGAGEGAPELEAALLSDLSGPDYVLGENQARGRWTTVAVLLLVPLAAVLIYLQVGDDRWTLPPLNQQGAGSQSHAEVDIPQLLQRLERSLAENPGNADGWAIAGRTYMVMNQFDKAEAAYARVHALVGDDPDILTAWADASLMRNGGRYTAEISVRIERALELDPVQVNALWIGALGSNASGDRAAAMGYLERLEPLLADNPEALGQLRQQLESASSGFVADPTETASSGSGDTRDPGLPAALIELEVSIAPELRENLDPATPVFVFARAKSGPPMPLAARRLTVGDLPGTVRLDDASAMIEGRNLSGEDRVDVTARVALSGSPSAQSGDLTSESVETVTRGGAPIRLRVDRRVP